MYLQGKSIRRLLDQKISACAVLLDIAKFPSERAALICIAISNMCAYLFPGATPQKHAKFFVSSCTVPVQGQEWVISKHNIQTHPLLSSSTARILGQATVMSSLGYCSSLLFPPMVSSFTVARHSFKKSTPCLKCSNSFLNSLRIKSKPLP